MWLPILSLLSLLELASACGDDSAEDHQNHVHFHGRHTGHGSRRKRADPSVPLSPPTRQLEWSDLNIIHTTDTHGWLLGHQKESFPEPNYSGDLGDFASFVTHMKDIAKEKDVDLLLIDSGDLHDGTGLSDGFPPGGIDAHDSNEFLKQLDYNVMAIGNHELYIYNNTLDMALNFAPKIKGHYLSSNVNITLTDPATGATVDRPVGDRFAKFQTTKGRNVTAMGIIFDFTGNDKNTTVQKVEDMVKEAWFADAIQDKPDLFLMVGHMPVKDANWGLVHDTIRAVHNNTPIIILGGHSHIRDCQQLDQNSMSLASGRYMETVGWMSISFPNSTSDVNSTAKFTRRYLDANTVTYAFHTNTSTGADFHTDQGRSITQGLMELFDRFDLNFTYGVAPQDYLMTRAVYPGNDSEASLFAEEGCPVALAINNTRANIPNLIIAQSGSLRFDIYKGVFNKNDRLTATPFLNGFNYIPNVPFSLADAVTPKMNSDGSNNRKRSLQLHKKMWDMGHVDRDFYAWLAEMDRLSGVQRRQAGNTTLGYVTNDTCPGVGDDVVHAPMEVHAVPDFLVSRTPAGVQDDTPIDLVFVDFFQDQLIDTLNELQSGKNYSAEDVQKYSELFTADILGVYAQARWN